MKTKLKITLTSLTLLLCASSSVYAASISGTIIYEGKAPKFKEIKMDADPICVMHNAEARFPQTLVLGENQTMGNVFIHVVKGLPKKTHETPTEPVVLTQKGCMYDPHVIALMVGQPLKILNPDGTLHNVHALSKINDEFNIAMPKFRKEMTKTFDKEEFMFPIKCDVHPWMIMYDWSADTPHHLLGLFAVNRFSVKLNDEPNPIFLTITLGFRFHFVIDVPKNL